jgi:hypothetical protein
VPPVSDRVDDRAGAALERVQLELEALYQLEPAPTILPFVRRGDPTERERVLVKETADALEVLVVLPDRCLEALSGDRPGEHIDAYLEAVEGVSHFLHLAERARTQLPTTLLELELQAEVDKFAVLAPDPGGLPATRLHRLHRQLYAEVGFLHPAHSEPGQRYRLANDLAARLWARLIDDGRADSIRGRLRRFYRASQAEKIRMARAA